MTTPTSPQELAALSNYKPAITFTFEVKEIAFAVFAHGLSPRPPGIVVLVLVFVFVFIPVFAHILVLFLVLVHR